MSEITFHSLHCIGYLDQKEQGRYGLVFDVPGWVDNFTDIRFETKTFFGLLQELNAVSLYRLIHVALALAEAVLQLHTARWLHKALRSDNAIFIASTSEASHMW